jgi:formate dehydrogenase maturation protein FdhE
MRVKCANCGMIYDINPTPMDFRTETECNQCAVCPKCQSNAKDRVDNPEWVVGNSEFWKY